MKHTKQSNRIFSLLIVDSNACKIIGINREFIWKEKEKKEELANTKESGTTNF